MSARGPHNNTLSFMSTRKTGKTNYHKLLFKNLTALMLFNHAPRPLKSCVSEDMFLCPNQDGFYRVSHFLMNVIYPGTQAFRHCWPVYTRSEERTFRTILIELIRGLNKDFGDIYIMSDLIPGRLMTPGGDRFVKIIWEISLLALGVQATRESKDDDIFIPEIPPATTPQPLVKKATELWRCHAKKKLMDGEAMLNELKHNFDVRGLVKKKVQERMFRREKKIREINAKVERLYKESCYEDVGVAEDDEGRAGKNSADIRKFHKDLNESKEKATVCDGPEVNPTELLQMLQRWKSILSLATDTKEILEAIFSEENSQPILDTTSISECQAASGAMGNYNIAEGASSEVSLLKYISDLHSKLEALHPELKEGQISETLSTWESFCQKEKLIKSDLIQMESKLEDEFLKVISLTRSDTVEDGSETEHLASSMNLSNSINLRTSTPVKKKQVSSETVLFKLTPHQAASNCDYFPVNTAEAFKSLSDKKEKMLAIVKINSFDSSFDELLERFKKIVIKREQMSTKPS